MARTKIQRILCPTDFSPIAERAFHHAVALARWYEARLVVLHAVPVPIPVPSGRFQAYAGGLNAVAGAEHHLLQALERWVAPAEEAGVQTEIHVREGNASRTIVDLAAALPADLVVIGTHGREGFQRLVLGSVAEKVLRQAPCPVLTVPPAAQGSAGGHLFRRILCPVDFSGASERALQYALSLAQEAKASLELVHVVEWGPDPQASEMVGRFDLPEYRRFVEEDARRRLGALVPAEAREWCEVSETLVAGKPWQEVLRRAEGRADVIVMGVRGRGALDVALFGSNTHHVVRGADCPVLTVHEGPREAPRVAAATA
jgi:nucleotide-binding universal stress UspA family protein